MATAKNEDKKVFDVAKPGKTAASASSRPLIIGHKNMLKDPMVKDAEPSDLASKADNVSAPTEPEDKPSGNPKLPETLQEPTTAPAVAKVKLQPLNEGEEVKIKKPSKIKIIPDQPESGEEPETAPTVEDTIAEEPKQSIKKTEAKVKDETEEQDTSASTEPTTSESAAVDAMAVQAEAQKKAEQEAKEITARQALVDKLVAEKKYFVPINVSSRRRHSRWSIVIFVVLILIIGAYIAADAGLIDLGFKLPIDLIKN